MKKYKSRKSGSLRNMPALAALSLAGLVAGASSQTAADVYLSAPKNEPANAYVYHNAFPEGVGNFVSSAEVGGDVFAAGLQPGDKFPLDIKIQDESNQEHSISSFTDKGPLILVLTLVSAPTVMERVTEFQNFVKSTGAQAQIAVVNVGQFGSALQPKTPMADNGRTIKVAAREYGITLPLYWVQNDIYTADGFTNRLHARDLPSVYVIGKDGKIIREFGSSHTKWASGDLAVK